MSDAPVVDELRVQEWLWRHGQGPSAGGGLSHEWVRAIVSTRLPADASEAAIDLAIDLIDNPNWLAIRTLPDGRFAGVMPQMFGGGRLGVNHRPDSPAYHAEIFESCWQYERAVDAIAALAAWDPTQWPEPPGFSWRPTDGPRIQRAIAETV